MHGSEASAPLESIERSLATGEIAPSEALRRATSPDVFSKITSEYVRTISTRAVTLARGDWRSALGLARIVLAAASAAPEGDDAAAARTSAGLAFISVATEALVALPDGRVLAEALAAGAWLLSRAPSGPVVAEASFRLGLLHFEPYYFSGDYTNYAMWHNHWLKRFELDLGMSYAAVTARAPAMPEPDEAFATAERYLRATLDEPGREPALALKTLVDCVRMRVLLFSEENRVEELGALARRSIVAADGGAEVPAYIQTIVAASLVTEIDPPAVLQRITDFIALEPAQAVLRYGAKQTIATASAAIYALRRTNDARGTAVLERYRDTFERLATERERNDYYLTELEFFKIPTEGGVTRPLMTIAGEAQARNAEASIVAFLDEFERTMPAAFAAHAGALAYLRYRMSLGLAANAFAAGNWAEAIVHDGECLSYCFMQRYAEGALTSAARIEDLASRSGDEVAAKAAAVLQTMALWLERLLGERGMRLVQSICRQTFAGMFASGAGDTRAIVSLLQSSKNLRISSALRGSVRYDAATDAEGRSLLSEIAALEGASAEPLATELDEDTLLSSFMQEADREAGATDAERLRNLRRAFQRRVDDAFVAPTDLALLPHPDPERLKASLDERTVMLDYYLAATPAGRTCTTVLLITREETQFTGITSPLPWFPIAQEKGGRIAYTPPVGLTVSAARRGVITVDPGPRVVDPDVADILARDERALLGPFVEVLARLRAAGKDHLLVVASGPLHFYPWHLLGGPGRVLADNWIVTWAPSASSADLPRAEALATESAAAIGLSFADGGRFGLAPLKNSADKTRAVAAALGVPPLLDRAATKSAVLAALRSARYAHVSTHGLFDVAAPAFQCLVLEPEEGSDGRLFAYEIFGLDLRGLEVLTLSACETALGRFDLGDNVRGLPAAFLIAGVRTIVGTLWDASDAATAVFFPAFYASLLGGATHLDAFASAQRLTRTKFPKYWDWGAFFMMGSRA